MRKLFFLILIILIIAGGVYLWQEIYLPKNPASTETKIFQVVKGEGAREIALNLEKAGLVKWTGFPGLHCDRGRGRPASGRDL